MGGGVCDGVKTAPGHAVTFSVVRWIILTRTAMSEEHDDRLQVEAAQRDPSRFADLYEKNFTRVYAYVVRRVGDRHQAEDLTADVFREALAGIGKFERRGGPLSPWPPGVAARGLAPCLELSRPAA